VVRMSQVWVMKSTFANLQGCLQYMQNRPYPFFGPHYGRSFIAPSCLFFRLMLVSISYSLFANFVETTMFYWFLIIKKSLLICWVCSMLLLCVNYWNNWLKRRHQKACQGSNSMSLYLQSHIHKYQGIMRETTELQCF
jgi:hypothetical protein